VGGNVPLVNLARMWSSLVSALNVACVSFLSLTSICDYNCQALAVQFMSIRKHALRCKQAPDLWKLLIVSAQWNVHRRDTIQVGQITCNSCVLWYTLLTAHFASILLVF